jgi:hypothetical protein
MFKEGNVVKTIRTEDTELRPWWEMGWATRPPLNGNGVSYQAYYSEVGKITNRMLFSPFYMAKSAPTDVWNYYYYA